MTPAQKKEVSERYCEKFFDKNTPSGLNQKDFKSFPELVKAIFPFLLAELARREEEIVAEIEKLIDENDDGMWSGRETADLILTKIRAELSQLNSPRAARSGGGGSRD